MAHTAKRKDAVDGCYGRLAPQSEATPLQYSPEHEHANAPPHCVPAAALPAHGPSYAPHWNAPTLHSSVQDQRYGGPVPYVNDMARGYGVLTDAQQSTSFAPAMNAMTPLAYNNQNQNQDAGNAANDPMAYHPDNRIPPGRDIHGWVTTEVQPGGVINYGPILGGASSAQSAAGNDAQFASEGEAPAPSSESLRTLTRRYVLDPGTRIEAVHMGPHGYGRLKITITLEAADGI